MLEYIRSSAQSFGVKIAFGVIILVFVFWGVGNFNDRDYTNVVAVVNGEPILAMEFEKAYQSAEEAILRQNPGLTREQLAKQHLGRQVLRELIEQTLVMQEAARAGINVSALEMRNHAASVPAFQNEKGAFDPDAYKRALAARRMTPAQYEQELGRTLLADKMFNLVTSPVWVDPDESMRRFNFLLEKRNISLIFIPASRFEADVKVGEKEIEEWYESHKNDFTVPAKMNIAYIQLTPENLADPASFGKEELEALYQANIQRYTEPEQVKVSHILVPVPENASEEETRKAGEKIAEIRNELKKGASFAELADAYNPEGAAGPGGQLGWIGRNQTVAPFEDAVFSASPGLMEEAVRTPFGFHLILVEDKNPGGPKKFAEVEDDLRKLLAAEKGADKLHEVLDALIEDNIMDRSMAESASRYGLKDEKTGLLSKDELANRFGLSAQDADLLFSTPSGMPLDVALSAGDSYLIARAIETSPASIRPLNEVKEEIQKILAHQGALKDAMKLADKILQDIKDKNLTDQEKTNLEMENDITVSREGPVPGFLPDSSLMTDIFETLPEHWLPEAHAVAREQGDGALLVRVNKIIAPDPKEFANMEQILTNASRMQRKNALYSIFMDKLTGGAKIEITNPNLVDRVN